MIHKIDAEEALNIILDSLDALVYVADMQTYELIFINKYGRSVWGPSQGKKCYQVLQKDQHRPCAFCSNDKLLDAEGHPSGVYVWEFQNTQNGNWYQCRDQAIPWPDGRLVRIEIATDITERKLMEQALAESKALAEMRANTDVLTGVYNRRAFFELGRLMCSQAIRAERPLSVVMFDLDHFKRVNDRWGHAAGDAVLVALTQVAQDAIRASDILARLGGEEFAILLPDTDPLKAQALTQRIRIDIENKRIHYDDVEIQCTASFGIVGLDFSETDNPSDRATILDELLNRADQAMMTAKKSGRNQVRVANHLHPV